MIEKDRFWAAYPRKEDKGHAKKAWVSALRKADASAIIAGLTRHKFNEDPKYRPLASTWLNGERWSDANGAELALAPSKPSPTNPTGRQTTPLSGFV